MPDQTGCFSWPFCLSASKCYAHLTVLRPPNQLLKVEVLLELEEDWRHQAGCVLEVGRQEHLQSQATPQLVSTRLQSSAQVPKQTIAARTCFLFGRGFHRSKRATAGREQPTFFSLRLLDLLKAARRLDVRGRLLAGAGGEPDP